VLLGARRGRYGNDGRIAAHPPSSIPFLALGAWVLSVGWFGFAVSYTNCNKTPPKERGELGYS